MQKELYSKDFIKAREKFILQGIRAINQAGGNGVYAMDDYMDKSFSEFIDHICTNNVRLVFVGKDGE